MLGDIHDRPSTDSEILQLKTQIKHLADNDQHLAAAVDQLRTDYQNGLKELRDLIANRDRPQWVLVISGLMLFGAFSVYQINQITKPINTAIAALNVTLQKHEADLRAHTSNGHPYTVLSKVETLEDNINTSMESMRRLHDSDVRHINEKITRIDEKGSVVHFRPGHRKESE